MRRATRRGKTTVSKASWATSRITTIAKMAASILIVSSLARELFNNEVERLSHIVDEQRARFRTRRRLRRHDLTRLTSICPRCFLNEHTPQVSNRVTTQVS